VSLSAGTRLGPYEILSPLGAGGTGEVYRARDTRLERTVAIKVLPLRLSASPESRQRFEREAKKISQLSHPHICALYDVGNQDGVEYLALEYLEGKEAFMGGSRFRKHWSRVRTILSSFMRPPATSRCSARSTPRSISWSER
jgi:serine/threonine protein kinase